MYCPHRLIKHQYLIHKSVFTYAHYPIVMGYFLTFNAHYGTDERYPESLY